MNDSTSSSAKGLLKNGQRPVDGANSAGGARVDASVEPPIRFSLTGPAARYDPVHQAIRRDLADLAEASHHFAPHYAAAVTWHTVRDTALRAKPADDAETRRLLASGEAFALLDMSGVWAWGYDIDRHIVGYVRCADIAFATPG